MQPAAPRPKVNRGRRPNQNAPKNQQVGGATNFNTGTNNVGINNGYGTKPPAGTHVRPPNPPGRYTDPGAGGGGNNTGGGGNNTGGGGSNEQGGQNNGTTNYSAPWLDNYYKMFNLNPNTGAKQGPTPQSTIAKLKNDPAMLEALKKAAAAHSLYQGNPGYKPPAGSNPFKVPKP